MYKLVLCLVSVSSAAAWVQQPAMASTALLRMGDGGEGIPASRELAPDDPCWQNMLDDDCSMGTVYAANFVAADWIKSMPCGEGIEDCDMPEELTAPDPRTGGVESVDVMNLLGLKRAESVNAKKEGAP